MYKYSVLLDDKHVDRILPDTPYFRIEEGPFAGIDFLFTDIQRRIVKGEKVITWKFGVLFSPFKKVEQKPFLAALQEILNDAINTALEGEEITEIDDVPFLEEPTSLDTLSQAEVDRIIEHEAIFEEPL